jgi:predicted GIY-YIG superfamily endonuclease
MASIIEQIHTLLVNVTNIHNQLNYMKKITAITPQNEDVLHETEIEFRKLKRCFETTMCGTIFPFGTEYVYVWQLEQGKYYVGYSENLSRRLDEHLTEEGAIWTKRYKPVSIVEIVRGGVEIEKKKTLEYIKKYGFENVRGAGWCKLEYKVTPPEVIQALTATKP